MIGTVRYHLVREGIAITDGKIISELNFGFWTTLLEENHYKILIWRKIFRDVFPSYPLTGSIDDAVDLVSQKVNKIRSFRNRIFHYEPIINRNDLEQIRECILEVLNWINPQMYQLTKLFDEYDSLKHEYKKINKLIQTIDNQVNTNKRKIKKTKFLKRK